MPKSLTEEQLLDNYRAAAERLAPPDPAHQRLASILPTTHTFGCEKDWLDAIGKRHYRDVWHEILIEHGALISERKRSNASVPGVDEPQRTATESRSAGLFDYVFAYLGAHDAYYAKSPAGIDSPGFGVFLSLNNESFPRAHCGRRDLKATEHPNDWQQECFFARDGRDLAARQATHDPDHLGDFWHYWGSEQYCAVGNYCGDRWTWLFEFRFSDRVPINEFAALLWPHRLVGLPRGGRRWQPEGDLELFRRLWPTCVLVRYHWDFRNPTICLLAASEAVAQYFAATGTFPNDADDAIAWLRSTGRTQ